MENSSSVTSEDRSDEHRVVDQLHQTFQSIFPTDLTQSVDPYYQEFISTTGLTIEHIFQAPAVRSINDNHNTILNALSTFPGVLIENDLVYPAQKRPLNTLQLRKIPTKFTQSELLGIFRTAASSSDCPSPSATHGDKIVFYVNSWVITFMQTENALRAYRALHNLDIEGHRIAVSLRPEPSLPSLIQSSLPASAVSTPSRRQNYGNNNRQQNQLQNQQHPNKQQPQHAYPVNVNAMQQPQYLAPPLYFPPQGPYGMPAMPPQFMPVPGGSQPYMIPQVYSAPSPPGAPLPTAPILGGQPAPPPMNMIPPAPVFYPPGAVPSPVNAAGGSNYPSPMFYPPMMMWDYAQGSFPTSPHYMAPQPAPTMMYNYPNNAVGGNRSRGGRNSYNGPRSSNNGGGDRSNGNSGNSRGGSRNSYGNNNNNNNYMQRSPANNSTASMSYDSYMMEPPPTLTTTTFSTDSNYGSSVAPSATNGAVATEAGPTENGGVVNEESGQSQSQNQGPPAALNIDMNAIELDSTLEPTPIGNHTSVDFNNVDAEANQQLAAASHADYSEPVSNDVVDAAPSSTGATSTKSPTDRTAGNNDSSRAKDGKDRRNASNNGNGKTGDNTGNRDARTRERGRKKDGSGSKESAKAVTSPPVRLNMEKDFPTLGQSAAVSATATSASGPTLARSGSTSFNYASALRKDKSSDATAAAVAQPAPSSAASQSNSGSTDRSNTTTAPVQDGGKVSGSEPTDHKSAPPSSEVNAASSSSGTKVKGEVKEQIVGGTNSSRSNEPSQYRQQPSSIHHHSSPATVIEAVATPEVVTATNSGTASVAESSVDTPTPEVLNASSVPNPSQAPAQSKRSFKDAVGIKK